VSRYYCRSSAITCSSGYAELDKIPLVEVKRGDKVLLGTLHNGQDVVVEAGDCLAVLATSTIREPMFALVGAKLVQSGEPVGSAAIDFDNIRKTPAGIVLLAGGKLMKEPERTPKVLAEFKDKVTLLFYQAADRAGSSGETRVLTTLDGELWRLAVLGTEEGDAVLKEYTLKAAKKATKVGLAEEDEEEDM
jgi:hypothetical protein